MDDILIHGTDETHDGRVKAVLEHLEKVQVHLNPDKCEFRKPRIKYFGHVISAHGIEPDPDQVESLINLEPPENSTKLKSVVGMFQYLGKFLPNLSGVMRPMTDLLKSGTDWTWGPDQKAAFLETKKLLTNVPVLEFYDPNSYTVVSADASSYGLGAVLLQLHGKQLKPVAFASRTLTEAERRYAQIEKEYLASVWACEKFSQYLVGLKEFKLLTDHKPLVPLMNTKDIDKCPVRCQRLLLRLMRFNPLVEYVPGKEQVVLDVLSRKPIDSIPNMETVQLAEEVDAYVDAIETGWPASPDRLHEIRVATQEDPDLRTVCDFVLTGWPCRETAIAESIRPFYQVRSEMSIIDGLLTYCSRIVVPQVLRQEMLSRLHESHQHISKSRDRANSAIWWPHINRDIKQMVENCPVCQKHKPTQREQPLRPIPLLTPCPSLKGPRTKRFGYL